MSFFVWKTSIQCKLNDIKTDIVGSHKPIDIFEKQSKKLIQV